MCIQLAEYFEEHGMEYKQYLIDRREALSVDGLAIYREACRQQNAFSGGSFQPLAKVDEDDADGLRQHDTFIGVAEALTSHPFQVVSRDLMEAAQYEYGIKHPEEGDGK